MTRGENIWEQAIRRWWGKNLPPGYFLPSLGKIVAEAIDENFADLKRDHEAEIAELKGNVATCPS